ncbi:cysteine hydrolase family protein [Chitinimonas sp. BJB300]|uniref:cysteine hydrolase family protein n=1 Tax=Chitinimonas sp. BJB300 TaxID=1559339 RepID=UPI000C111B0E|nr:cysteine hydrolase [Chitinimonas sp. BJB300]PHV09553.1 isochorismatase [Chitinimonas sp. BJB300]TSJ85614.1 cysteine hydrolase [Chitinimonas sp. BJB300]
MKTALIVIDLINDITHAEGKIPSCAVHVAERQVIAKANQALQFARAKRWLPILVKVGFSEGYHEQPKNSPLFGTAHLNQVLKLGQWGTAFRADLDVQPSDLVVVKPRINPFYASALEAALRANKIERLVVCGVSTTWAIQSMVRDAHDRDYQVVILEDACAAADEQEHSSSITQLSRIAKVMTVGELPALD